MNVSKLAPYTKAVVAVLGALVATVACFADGTIDSADVVTIVTVWGTVFGVYQVTNKPGVSNGN